MQFQPPTYTVVESDFELNLTVVREGALSQPASVFFRTVEDTAEGTVVTTPDSETSVTEYCVQVLLNCLL